MSVGLYNNAQIRKVTINGVDQTQNVREIYTATSIFTPFQSCHLKLVDASRIQDVLYKPGIPVKIVYTAGDGSIIREYDFVTASNRKGFKINSNRSGYFNLTCVSKPFFSLSNEHSSYHENTPVSEVMKKLHKEYAGDAPLDAVTTKGLISSGEPFHLRGMQLGEALGVVRNRAASEKYNTASYVYFVDQEGKYHFKPVEQLFEEANKSSIKFTHSLKGNNFLQNQREAAFNIFSLKRHKSDDLSSYQSLEVQRGGDPGTGLDLATLEYKPPQKKDYDLSAYKTPGGTKPDFVDQKQNKINYTITDSLQNSRTFEDDTANRNVLAALTMQNLITINVPLEGGLNCLVGTGCDIDMPAEVGDQNYKKSASAGKQLIVAQGEYIFMDKNRLMRAVASIQTTSGGNKDKNFAAE